MYSTGSESLDQLIATLLRDAGASRDLDLLQEIVTSAVKLVQDGTERPEIKLINTALKEMRYAFKVFRPYRAKKKVTIFGSARIKSGDAAYEMTKRFAQAIAERDWMVITGAGPGIMEAGIEGAGSAMSFGVNIRLPFEAVATPFIAGDPKLINFKYFFTRKLMFVKESQAIVLLPGGFGTMDECFEALTLIQTGKALPVPFVLLEPPGSNYWTRWIEFVNKELVSRNLISPSDLNLFAHCSKIEEAVEEITKFYRNYHSIRYVHDLLILRVRYEPTKELLDACNDSFRDILVEGGYEASRALPEEASEPELADLPRIVCRFDRYNYGRLRLLIDLINRLGVREELPTMGEPPHPQEPMIEDDEDGEEELEADEQGGA